VDAEWLRDLENRLVANPQAIMGEIGLDKVATTPDTGRCEYESQIPVSGVRPSPPIDSQSPYLYIYLALAGGDE